MSSLGSRPLRMGIVGFGAMGRRHLEAMTAVGGVLVVGVADTAPAHHAPVADLEVTGSLTELLALGIDACVVASPSPDHVGSAVQLADAGVHALVEKPLAMDVDECQRILDAFDAAGLVGRVAHVERFNGSLVALRECVQRGDIGAIREVATRREAGPPRRADGGDVLLDLGTHDLDLVSWLTAEPYEPVELNAEPIFAEEPDELRGQALAVHGRSGRGFVTHHVVSWRAEVAVRRVAVHGTSGSLEADLLRGELRRVGRDELLAVSVQDPLTAQLEAFRDLIVGRRSPDDPMAGATLADGARAVLLARSAMAALSR